jgi:hypothetical protein
LAALGVGALDGSVRRRGEEGQGGEALAEPGLEGDGTEQTADHEDGDQGGIGGVEDAGEDGKPGEDLGVVGVAQRLDDVLAVSDQGVEEAEDVAGAGARGHGPIGIGLDGFGLGGGDDGHGSIKAQIWRPGPEFFPS